MHHKSVLVKRGSQLWAGFLKRGRVGGVKRLDFNWERSNNSTHMKWRSNNVIAIVLVAFFALGVLCSAVAAPGQALASVDGCSDTMMMAGCEHPTYLCGFDLAGNILSPGAQSSSRSSDSLKDALGLAVGAPSVDVSMGLAPPGARESKNISLADRGKVSVRLLNSTLNL